MKKEKMYRAITEIRPDIIEQAEKQKLGKKQRWMKRITAAAAALLMVGGIGSSLWNSRLPGGMVQAYAIAEAEYPVMISYPIDWNSDEEYDAWSASMDERNAYQVSYTEGLTAFFQKSMECILKENEGKNVLYSPLNVYMALSMLAELTDGSSREQILMLLGVEDIETLRTQASDIWNASYRKDGAVSSVLGSSVWLNEDISFHQETMERLADIYYASSYQGEMGSEELDKKLQNWLNEQTGGLLEEQAKEITLDSETVMALATTLYFQSKWQTKFWESMTEAGTFYGKNKETEVNFMTQIGSADTYYWAEQFGAISVPLENKGRMWFLLPDEGVSPEELLEGNDVVTLIKQHTKYVSEQEEWKNQKTLVVNSYIPKFDVVSQTDLNTALQTLGVTDVFDPESSDFTPMTSAVEGIFLSDIKHDVRVAIDEEGVTAAAYTVMPMYGAGLPPEEEMDFRLDRPFLFVITSKDGLPLFTGIINDL